MISELFKLLVSGVVLLLLGGVFLAIALIPALAIIGGVVAFFKFVW